MATGGGFWVATREESLITFTKETVEPGCSIRTDDWSGYGTLPDEGYLHTIVH